MRNLILSSSIIALLAIACNKSTNSPTPNPVPQTPKDSAVSGWTKISVDTSYLLDIFFENAQVGYTGGDKIFKTNDGGNTWTEILTINMLANLYVAPGDQLHAVDQNPYKIYNFSNWATQQASASLPVVNPAGADLFFTDDNTGFITSGTDFLNSTDAGVSWKSVSAASGLNLLNSYSTLFFIDSTTGWIGNCKFIYKTNGSILKWTEANINPYERDLISSVFAANRDTIYAGFFDGMVIKSTDGGLNFNLVHRFSQTSERAYLDLHFLDSNTGYACYNNRLYKTIDGGNSWSVEVATNGDNIIEIHFLDKQHGWACTRGGKVWKYLVN